MINKIELLVKKLFDINLYQFVVFYSKDSSSGINLLQKHKRNMTKYIDYLNDVNKFYDELIDIYKK